MRPIRRLVIRACHWVLLRLHTYFAYAHRNGAAQYETGKAAWEARQTIKDIEHWLSQKP